MATKGDELLTAEEVAKILGITTGRGRKLAIDEELIGEKIGFLWVFTRDQVDAYIARRRPRGRPKKTADT